jgi:hypothetical protein
MMDGQMNRPTSGETPRPLPNRRLLWRGMFIAIGIIALALTAITLSTTMRGTLSSRTPIALPLTLKNHPASGLELLLTDGVPSAFRISGVIELCIGTQSAAVMQSPEFGARHNEFSSRVLLTRSTPHAGVEASFDNMSWVASWRLTRVNAWLNVDTERASPEQAFDDHAAQLQTALNVAPATDGFILAGESIPTPDCKARFKCGPNDLIVTLPDRNHPIIRMMLYESAEPSANVTPPAPR